MSTRLGQLEQEIGELKVLILTLAQVILYDGQLTEAERDWLNDKAKSRPRLGQRPTRAD